MTTARKAIPRVAAVAIFGLALTACGGGGSHPSVASLPGGSTATGQGTLTQAQGDQLMVAFTRCMRSRGVQISDPFHRPGHQGLTLDLPSHTVANAPAYAACQSLIDPVVEQKEAGAKAAATSDLPALISYAQCMRSHDISMLDPRPDGALSLGQVPGITGDYGRYSPQFRSADRACQHLLPAGVHDDGTGP